MTFPKKVVGGLAGTTVIALLLLLVSGVFTTTAATGNFRIHINTGTVVIGHGAACFVQEGTVDGTSTGAGSAVGMFTANLKVVGGLPDAGKPCGTIHGIVNFEFDPHLAGFFGFWFGTVTEHSGPTPEGVFVGARANGSWQINHVARQGTGNAIGEGVLNATIF